MWRLTYLLVLVPMIWSVASRPMEPAEWLHILEHTQRVSDGGTDVFRAFDEAHGRDLSNTEGMEQKEEEEEEANGFISSADKRALSMFARWGSVNSIGKERSPIRSGYSAGSMESISTQTRSRMLGQPLRWG
ncbi:uncharacterized protein LOC132700742 [Cylas formicarius]|uniref:uncharacterized protein LOC132700742 n=1 Tax=Cylas formicarius TaxID=197179 RepID=UPI0029585424|nr:uncharacterized protein LOC132700742 [Cylas formicarius]